jgi:hypothetical protein
MEKWIEYYTANLYISISTQLTLEIFSIPRNLKVEMKLMNHTGQKNKNWYLLWAASSSSTSSFWHFNASASLSASHAFTYVKGNSHFITNVVKNRIMFNVWIWTEDVLWTSVQLAHFYSSKSNHMTSYVAICWTHMLTDNS